MFFGKKLKDLRLKYANIGLSSFSREMGMIPSEYSAIEYGYSPPPTDEEWFVMLCSTLKIVPLQKEALELYFLWQQKFVMQMMPENIFPSPMSSKIDGSILKEEELIDLYDFINSISKEHNKKAIEFNKEQIGNS